MKKSLVSLLCLVLALVFLPLGNVAVAKTVTTDFESGLVSG